MALLTRKREAPDDGDDPVNGEGEVYWRDTTNGNSADRVKS